MYFSDCPPSSVLLFLILSWLCGSVVMMQFNVIMVGSKTTFRPNQPIPLLSRWSPNHTITTIPSQHFKDDSNGFTTNFKEGFYVASLQGVPGSSKENTHRLDAFQKYFAKMCPSLQIKHCPGVIDSKKRPGYGIAKTWTRCLTRALDVDDVDVAYFFEDDARFRDDIQKYDEPGTHPFCKRTLRERIWWSAPIDTFLVLFGGWHFRYGGGRVFKGGVGVGTFYETDNSWGSYAWAVPSRENMRALLNGFQKDINGVPDHAIAENGTSIEMISPDETKHQHAIHAHKAAYMLSPLWFVHPAGYSNTWGYKVGHSVPMEQPPLNVKYLVNFIFFPLFACWVVLIMMLCIWKQLGVCQNYFQVGRWCHTGTSTKKELHFNV
jgi:hypothetical protein